MIPTFPGFHHRSPLDPVEATRALSLLLEAFKRSTDIMNLQKGTLVSDCPFCGRTETFALSYKHGTYNCSSCRQQGEARDLFSTVPTIGKSSVDLRLQYSSGSGLTIGHGRNSDEPGLSIPEAEMPAVLDRIIPFITKLVAKWTPPDVSTTDAESVLAESHIVAEKILQALTTCPIQLNLTTNQSAALYHRVMSEFAHLSRHHLSTPADGPAALLRFNNLTGRLSALFYPDLPTGESNTDDSEQYTYYPLSTQDVTELLKHLWPLTRPEAALPFTQVGQVGIPIRLVTIDQNQYLLLSHSPDNSVQTLYYLSSGRQLDQAKYFLNGRAGQAVALENTSMGFKLVRV